MAGHVYILGAGFSVPLGGPLFSQLLTTELQLPEFGLRDRQVKQLVASLQLRPSRPGEYYDRDIDIQFRRRHRPILAEELMALLDTAIAQPSSEAARVMNGLRGDVPLKQLLWEIKRVVAFQCSSFVLDLDYSGEAVQPFSTWASGLASSDSVITFNYDLIVESVAGVSQNPVRRIVGEEGSRRPQLLKLHGSVDWRWGVGDDVNVIDYQRGCAVNAADLDIAIGLPGRDKASFHQRGPFAEIWNQAAARLRNADTVSIIGYSMPMTDNIAKHHILGSLASNPILKQVNLVLGPGSGTFTAGRLTAMIEPLVSCPVYDVKMHAQDFLRDVDTYRVAKFR